MTARLWARAASGLLTAVLLACGGGDEAPARPGGGAAAPSAGDGSAARSASPEPAEEGAGAAPRIRSVRLDPPDPASGENVTAVVEAEDPDGDPVSLDYEWRVKGRVAGGNEPRLLLLGASKRDVVEVVVTPHDGERRGEPVRAKARVRNRAPELQAVQIEPSGTITGSDDIVLRPRARDVDGDELMFEYRWTVNGRSLDHGGPVLETDQLQRGDVVQVTVTASDGDETSDPIRTPELRVANGVPRITSQPEVPEEGQPFSYRVRAEDPDGDRLSFSLDEAPSGMDINPVSGEISWRPRADAEGPARVRIRVEDMQGGEALQEFELTLGGGAAPAAPQP